MTEKTGWYSFSLDENHSSNLNKCKITFIWKKSLISIENIYRPFHKTLPRSRAFVNWISVRFYEMDCM